MENLKNENLEKFLEEYADIPNLLATRTIRISSTLMFFYNKCTRNLDYKEKCIDEGGCREITMGDIEFFNRQYCKFKYLCQTKISRKEIYNELIKMNDDVEYWERVCRRYCCYDWNQHLTSVPSSSDKPLDDFAFVVRAVEPCGYKNELLYPTVSASLFTPQHDILYLDRKVAFVLNMDSCCLVGMSAIDSTTAEDSDTSIFNFPVHVGNACISDTFAATDQYFDFRCYNELLVLDNPGKLIFDSKVEVQAVMYFDDASKRDIEFAKSYACVYNLPVLMYKRGKYIVRVNTKQDCIPGCMASWF